MISVPEPDSRVSWRTAVQGLDLDFSLMAERNDCCGGFPWIVRDASGINGGGGQALLVVAKD